MFKTILLSTIIIASFPRIINQPVMSYDWNSSSLTRESQTVTTFYPKWINYLSEDHGWQDIDTNFYPVEGGFAMTRAPFKAFAPEFSDGGAVFHNDNKWDTKNKKEITDPPLDMTITPLDIQKVEGKIVKGDLIVATGLQRDVNYVLYENAYRDADLIYYVDFGAEPRLMKLVRFHKKPKQLQYKFEIKYSQDVEFYANYSPLLVRGVRGVGSRVLTPSLALPTRGREWNIGETRTFDGEDNSISVFRKGSDIRGIGFWKFRIWDSFTAQVNEDRHIQNIKIRMKYLGDNTFIQTKILPRDFFNKAVYPVYTDTVDAFYSTPLGAAGTVDGEVYASSDADFSIIRALDGDISDDSGNSFHAYRIRSSSTSNQYTRLHRGILYFDANSLNGETLCSATLSIMPTANLVDGLSSGASANSKVVVVQGSSASDTALTGTDFSSVLASGTTSFGESVVFNSLAVDTFEVITLNANGIANIDTGGNISRFATMAKWDFSNTTSGLTWASSADMRVDVYSAEMSDAAWSPALTVTHVTGACPSAGSRRIVVTITD